MCIVGLAVEVAVGQLRANGEPAGPDGHVPAEHVQTPPSQAEMFHDVEDLFRLLDAAELWFLRDDEVDVYVGMDEVPIRASSHGTLDAHQTVFLGALKDCARF